MELLLFILFMLFSRKPEAPFAFKIKSNIRRVSSTSRSSSSLLRSCSKCSLEWHYKCMRKIAEENFCDEFDEKITDVCTNCFVDSKLFWTSAYKPWKQFSKSEKSWIPKIWENYKNSFFISSFIIKYINGASKFISIFLTAPLSE